MLRSPLFIQAVAPENWPDISARFHDLTYEQSLTYGQAAARRIGARAQFVKIIDSDGLLLAAACLRVKQVPGLGRGIAWIAAGPLVRHRHRPDPTPETLGAVLSALRAYAQDAGHILRLRFAAVTSLDAVKPDAVAEREGFRFTTRAARYRTVIINCTHTEDHLMQRLHQKWRNPLRNALKAGMHLECGPLAEHAERFHALYHGLQATKGFNPDIPPEFYYPLNGPDFTHDVLIAHKDGTDLAAMTVGRSGSNAVYLFGATSETGRRVNAGYYLMWQTVLQCKKLGMENLDLGGIDPETNPSVARFKLRTGGHDVLAPGPYEYRPAGIASVLIRSAETLHTKIKARL